MLLSECLEKFIISQKIKGNSNKTISNYIQQINYFIQFVNDIDSFSISQEHYNEYVVYLTNKHSYKNHKLSENNLSSFTIKTYLTHIKVFLNFCCSEGFMNNKIEFITYKTRKDTIVVLSNDEIRQILSYYDVNTFLGCRNLLIISLMLDCGLRRNEVVNLYVTDVNLEYNIVRVLGKGNKERLVPLSDKTKELFLLYVNTYHVVGFLFTDENGLRITGNCISCFVRRLRIALGFRRLHPHFFRHTFATLFLINGGDVFHLQLILGHTTLSMTQKYVHIATQMTIANQRCYSPISNLNKKS